MNLEDASSRRHNSGPWMIKITGHWGSGQHSKNDFDIYILDLSTTPDHDPDLPSEGRSTFIPAIEEDEEPTEGLAVVMGTQVLDHGPDGPELRDVDDA